MLRDTAEDGVPEWLIDRWLEEDEFAQQVVRRHRSYLWNNVSNVRLINRRSELGETTGSTSYRHQQ